MATIMIADDDPDTRNLVSTVLGYAGHRVREATDGAEALTQAQAEPPDMVIADLMMPTIDGFEFARQLRKIKAMAQTPVVFFTGTYYLEAEARTLAKACGVTRIITKPAEPQQILEIVSQSLGVPRIVLAPSAVADCPGQT